jgi:hypothetical protein
MAQPISNFRVGTRWTVPDSGSYAAEAINILGDQVTYRDNHDRVYTNEVGMFRHDLIFLPRKFPRKYVERLMSV